VGEDVVQGGLEHALRFKTEIIPSIEWVSGSCVIGLDRAS
jgi:hypothetical protein